MKLYECSVLALHFLYQLNRDEAQRIWAFLLFRKHFILAFKTLQSIPCFAIALDIQNTDLLSFMFKTFSDYIAPFYHHRLRVSRVIMSLIYIHFMIFISFFLFRFKKSLTLFDYFLFDLISKKKKNN